MNAEESIRTFCNGESVSIHDFREMPLEDFLQSIVELTGLQWHVCSYFGIPEAEGVELWCILSGKNSRLTAIRSWVESGLPSIVAVCPEVHLFEREIAEQCGIHVVDHPWLKPLRYHHSWQHGRDAWVRSSGSAIAPSVSNFFRVEGDEIHEVAVGPVHAGIIEPGHFRFQCHGEKVYHLEISLGYQYRGIEKAIAGGPHRASMAQMETVAGDTTIGHSTAYAMITEALSGIQPSETAESIRAIALELERLANHCGDLGALAGDVGYLPTMSYCGRIRGDFLNMTALLCGSRFGRGLVRPGGCNFGCSASRKNDLASRLRSAGQDYSNAVELLWESASVMARFSRTGQVRTEDALALGLVGPAARGCGIDRDVRQDHPFGIYRTCNIPQAIEQGGDVLARASLRWKESRISMEYILERLEGMVDGELLKPCRHLAGEQLTVAMVEGWRGEICHTAITDKSGIFRHYKIKDPSFNNWSGLAMSLRNEQISDFPLCNKSFNLSYCGFDL
jgi:Ni,Fe-hydrogenase III large subunit